MGDMEDIDDEAIDGDMVSQSEEEIWRVSGQGWGSFPLGAFGFRDGVFDEGF